LEITHGPLTETETRKRGWNNGSLAYVAQCLPLPDESEENPHVSSNKMFRGEDLTISDFINKLVHVPSYSFEFSVPCRLHRTSKQAPSQCVLWYHLLDV